ncbi:hypothetical protein ACXYMP_06470 [Aliiroseovarius sp. CAU 1755]
MQINMASTEALDIIARDYSGQSKPMSINARPTDAQSIAWWGSSSKTETVDGERKRAALHLYLTIASRAVADLPPNTFPAAFQFNDRAKYRPDKGLIKALLQAGAVESCDVSGELCFTLTGSGQRIIGAQS